ncbi:class I SAM-dependent methyltransferase [Pseudomonas sp. SGAir0191]|uniref:class I SAM-dependent methyltransferase n=1 Tax=Pseudomonas sp. SGAir0191 TaxID=2217867 RepID=UPI000C2C22E3|nr:class I SAM-dependent methyltransferase [Pseudomonas sp. SGAir0191]AUA33540.1 class I SAM-dependent methyltransferase [Pseudomonas sp. SGAir0191]
MNPSLQLNQANWDERAPLHAASQDYQFDQYVQHPAHLSQTVQFDLPMLGNVEGLRAVHLQCHVGTDTLSLARLGADVCGLDFSAASLAQAQRLATLCATPIDYHQADVYAAALVLPAGTFDLVYTGIGALCWLPRIAPWAQTVAALLKPGGRLFLREGHPMLWAVNEGRQDRLQLDYPYFECEQPTVWQSDETYVATSQRLTNTQTHEWNHGLGELITALMANGLQLTALVEHQSVPWEALPGQMAKGPDGEWRLREQPARLPLSYTLTAVKT